MVVFEAWESVVTDEREETSTEPGQVQLKVLPKRGDGNLVLYGADEIQPQKFDGMRTSLNMWLVRPR